VIDPHLTIRATTRHDTDALQRLTRRERHQRLAGPALIAERNGIAIAAVALTSGRTATDASPHAADAARALRRRRYEVQRQGGDVGPAWLLLRRPVRPA
jgi:hypothetical protein